MLSERLPRGHMVGDWRNAPVSGFVLALLGFLHSRLAVVEAMAARDPVAFALAELPPLVVGLVVPAAGWLSDLSVPVDHRRTS